MRIAMWSCPRNISTAMMRAWENRPDTFVWDEPLYAHYLQHTAALHPGADEVIAHDETDWRKVVERLTGPAPGGKQIFFQKQMTHHLLPHIDRRWLGQVNNCFLIREPREMITSYLRIVPEPTLADTGYAQLAEIFSLVRREGGAVPPVLEARDVLNHPREMLTKLCERLGVAFDERMLSWPPGPRPTDGVWARHWYGSVEKSTSFRPYEPKPEEVPERFAELHARCDEFYEQLYELRITP